MKIKDKLIEYQSYLDEQNHTEQLDLLIRELSLRYNVAFEEYCNHFESFPNGLNFSLETENINVKIEVLSELQILHTHLTYEKNRNVLVKIIKKHIPSIKLELTELIKWDNFLKIMKDYNIELIKLKGYKEINEVRIFSNYIKHSNFDSNVKSDPFFQIPEFSKYKSKKGFPLIYLHPKDINLFYDRTKYSGYNFLNNISNEIISSNLF